MNLSVAIIGVYVVCTASIPLWHWLMGQLGKKTVLSLCIVPVMGLCIGLLFYQGSVAVVVSFCTLAGFFFGGITLVPAPIPSPLSGLSWVRGSGLQAPQSMLPDVIAAFSIENGPGREPTLWAVNGFVDSAAAALASGLTTYLLQVAGYDSGAGTEQPPMVGTMLRLVLGVGPTLFLLVGLLFLWEYPIDEEERILMQDKVHLRPSSRGIRRGGAHPPFRSNGT